MRLRSFKSAAAVAMLAGGAIASTAWAESPFLASCVLTPNYQDSGIDIAGDGYRLSERLFDGYLPAPSFALIAGISDCGQIDNTADKDDSRKGGQDGAGIASLHDSRSPRGRVDLGHAKLDTPDGVASSDGRQIEIGVEYPLTRNVLLASWELEPPEAFGITPNIDPLIFGVRVRF